MTNNLPQRNKARELRKQAYAHHMDFNSLKFSRIARYIIRDTVTKGMPFKTAFSKYCNDFCLNKEEQEWVKDALVVHGWEPAYALDVDWTNQYKYYLSPLPEYDYI